MPDPLSDEGLYNVWPDPIQPTDTQIVITSGVPLDLTQVIPGAGAALTVYGDVVSVSKDIRFESGALTIYARQIATTTPTTIDVSGTDGQGYAPGDAAAGGSNDFNTDGGNGGSGSPGKNGPSATSSGTISIYAESYSGPVLTLRANGGKGGRGQDGGAGGRAGNGQGGGSAQAPQGPGEQPQGYQTYNGSPGQPGGTGGQGGAPGWGGSGGSAGQIVFSLATPLPSAGTIDAQSNGGAVGDLGTPGAGGSSGTGGTGGVSVQCLYAIGESGGQVWICATSGQGQNCTYIDAQQWCVDPPPFRPNGASPGPPPLAPPPAPPAPLAGATLAPALQGSAPYTSLAAKIPDAAHFFAWLETIMHATQRYFLAGQYNDTALRLSWLINITASAPAIAGWTPDNTTELTSLHQYCLTLMARLTSGLDFYGYPPNHISTISFHAYQDDLNSMVTLGSIVETAYKTYFQEAQTDEVRRAQIAGQISSDQAAITNWQNQITSTSITVKKTQDDLSALSGQIQAYKQALMTTDMQQFQLAVYNGEGCTWTMVLTAVGAILGVATGVGDIASLASAAALAEEAAKEASTLSNILKMISVVSYDLSNIANGFDLDRPFSIGTGCRKTFDFATGSSTNGSAVRFEHAAVSEQQQSRHCRGCENISAADTRLLRFDPEL